MGPEPVIHLPPAPPPTLNAFNCTTSTQSWDIPSADYKAAHQPFYRTLPKYRKRQKH